MNGVAFGGENLQGLQELQTDIGNRVANFMLQKCRIGMEIMGNHKNKRLWESLEQ